MYIKNEKDFLESAYYRQWNQVLMDSRLAAYLDKNNLTVIFYPHYEIQKYLHLFHTASNRIILADFANYDVQTLLKESRLLVTDYSSVFFDFAYMRKPVVYFQFDQNTFFSRHYNRGYFSFQNMGFGPVTEHAEAAVDAMLQSADRDFLPADMYRKRMEDFFPLYEQKNCERIYDAICSL
jgi:CDP-glycerol glycerophosphotransferase (TagB/SpsB family)